MNDRIRISREELFAPKVNKALEKEHRLRGRTVPDAPPISPLRKLLLSSLFYLPLAGTLAAFTAWLLVEPAFHDQELIAGEVMLVNTDPMVGFEWQGATAAPRALTVGSVEVYVVPGVTALEAGVDGQVPFLSLEEIEAGDVVEVAGAAVEGGPNTIEGHAIRPATEARAAEVGNTLHGEITWARILFFPLTAVLVALALLAAEGISSRNWVRMIERCGLGLLLTTAFCFLAFIPAGIAMTAGQALLDAHEGLVTVETISGPVFVLFTACRSVAWGVLGAALGCGMNLVRTTKVQLRNSVVGGALGGALGGAFFDPVARFVAGGSMFEEADLSRLVGMCAVGCCVGLFVALVDQLAREAWLRVRTGPLAGKAFVLYRSPTTVGSAPDADIYLFKDAEINARHAAVHRLGNRYEVEDLESRMGTQVNGQRVRRRRLESGDQIVLGATVLQFEERAKHTGSR